MTAPGGQSFDYLIAGQGLAGTLLAWHLLEKGQRVLVVDRDEADTSSKVAAGLVTPITGKRFVKTWRAEILHPYAVEFYREVEWRTGVNCYRELQIARLFADEAQRELWESKRSEPEFAPWVTAPDKELRIDEPAFHAECGGFEIQGGGCLDTRAFLAACRRRFEEQGAYRAAHLEIDKAEVEADGIVLDGLRAKVLLLCQGHEGSGNRFFDWVPFRNAKGEMIDLEMPGVAETRIVNRGNWLLPVGEGRYRSGSTYDWTYGDAGPTAVKRGELIENLRGLVRLPFEVTGQTAGIRPVIRHSRLLLGRHPHPGFERIGFFNGLGSKGVLNGPWFARHFAEHLVEGIPLDAEVDLRRNF